MNVPRIRTIKPDFCQSPDVARLSRDARLFFLQLLTEVDDCGRCMFSAKRLAGVLYPHDDDVTAADIERWTDEGCQPNSDGDSMLARYEHNGRSYLVVCKFNQHQVISKPTASKLPAPPSYVNSWVSPEDSAETQESPGVPRGGKGNGSGNGSGKGDTSPPNLALVLGDSSDDEETFKTFWDQYPKRNGARVGRAKALVQWSKLTRPQRSAAMAGLVNYERFCTETGTWPKDAERWVRDKLWQDWQQPVVVPRSKASGSQAATDTAKDLLAWARDAGD